MNRYNPDIHHRHSIRLKGYDYSQTGAYFVTLCAVDRSCYFEQFLELRQIIDEQWRNIPSRFSNVILDEYVIMPNHLHGILVIRRDTPCGYPDETVAPANRMPARGVPTVGEIVGAFKSLCINAWLKVVKTEQINARAKFWQANYYEHVIRNEGEMECVREYIINNPLQWELDRENPAFEGRNKQPTEKWMV
ncbi:MAG: hypothetical protein A2511_07240 [Deltaproteobacteria bacterium RIFOXYD12_FULL_50_9]|nr:MAG: hypothetical protein A2511_07240 [Deltaproteobacteria bacterium RIFOXYD12_FULL_50_9]